MLLFQIFFFVKFSWKSYIVLNNAFLSVFDIIRNKSGVNLLFDIWQYISANGRIVAAYLSRRMT